MRAHILSRELDSVATIYSTVEAPTQIELLAAILSNYGHESSRLLVGIRFEDLPPPKETKDQPPLILIPNTKHP